jgi:membrane protein YdbS with pleckstrin-like domain
LLIEINDSLTIYLLHPLMKIVKPLNIKEKPMSLGNILLVILILLLVSAFPTWSYSASWGYGPSGGVGVVLLVVILVLLFRRP